MSMIPRLPNDRHALVPCEGGLDITTPLLKQKPGRLQDSKNVEVGIIGGYGPILGYERFDGRPSPSSATFVYIPAEFTDIVQVGDTVVGVTSTATGVVVALEEAAIVVTKVTGTFDEDAEELTVGASVVATVTDMPVEGYAERQLTELQYRGLAADLYRQDITAVPGSGPVRGVCRFNGVTYAWRDDAAGTALAIYKSTSSGWVLVPLGLEIGFTNGGSSYEIKDGDTITGGSSGATATVARVVLERGDWNDGSAEGRLILESKTGTFTAEDLDVGIETSVAKVAGDATAITLMPGGKVKVWIDNFGGQSGTRRIYGCDGKNRGFEFDGTVYVPISTGMQDDSPTDVIVHKNHLFFAFKASAQHSGTGAPYAWSPVFGAAELAVGDDITGFTIERGSETGSALGILSRNSTHILYGSDDQEWMLVRLRREGGAFEGSAQDMGSTVMLDDRGIVMLKSVDTFGNFSSATLSLEIQSLIQAKKSQLTASCIVREKSQYRLFFADKTAIYATIVNGKVVGMTPIELEHVVTCIHSVEGEDGNEEIFFGSDNGLVYQMERGTSLDGTPLEWFAVLQYVNMGMPRVSKSFKSASVEISGTTYSEFYFGWELGYSSNYIHQPDYTNASQAFSRPRWDLGSWDQGFWDGQGVAPVSFKLAGTAENIAFIIGGRSAIFEPIMISGILTRYLPRRIQR